MPDVRITRCGSGRRAPTVLIAAHDSAHSAASHGSRPRPSARAAVRPDHPCSLQMGAERSGGVRGRGDGRAAVHPHRDVHRHQVPVSQMKSIAGTLTRTHPCEAG